MTCQTNPRNTRAAQTLLELVAATVIISTALVPALRLTRSSLKTLERVEHAERCHFLCVSKLEEAMALTCGAWSLSNISGNLSSSGWPQYHYLITRSDQAADGGKPNELAVVTTVVWFDEDGSGSSDGDEVSCSLSAKLARVQSYEYEATIHK